MGTTKIQWTSGPNGEPGYTFNPWIGCRKVAPECANCYAETLDKNRFSKTLGAGTKEHPVSHWGSGPRHRTSASNWKQPLKWNREAAELQRLAGLNAPGLSQEGKDHYSRRPRVFCASLADWLDDENVPHEWRRDLLATIYTTPNLDWLMLTKRPQNFHRLMAAASKSEKPLWAGHTSPSAFPSMARHWAEWQAGNPPANIWFGVSAGADQEAALDIPARVHFLSCEPMLGALEVWKCPRDTNGDGNCDRHRGGCPHFDWIIFGGESGRKARPCHVQWIADGVKFCQQHGIAAFVKQFGTVPLVTAARIRHHEWGEGNFEHWQNEGSGIWRVKLKDSHGGDITEWPEDLRVREFPTPR